MFNNKIQSLPIPMDILAREDMSLSEKIVYSFLRYRYNLSAVNPKFNDENGTFIFIEQKQIMDAAAMAKKTVENAFKKLVEIGLIEREKHRRTFKIYLKPYQVDERFIIPNKAAEAAQDDEKGIDPSVTPQETDETNEGQNNANTGVVDNFGDNMGINSDDEILTGVKNTPIDEKGVKNTPNLEIDAKNTPKNNTIYNNTKDNNINNKHNLTLLKGHMPTVVIDEDIYIAFNKCFNKKPNVEIKQDINALVDRGIDKGLIIEAMKEAAKNNWSWGSARKTLTDCVPSPMVELSEEQQKARMESLAKFKPFNYRVAAEPSEWDGVEQLVYL